MGALFKRRDLLWLTVVIALAVAWRRERSALRQLRQSHAELKQAHTDVFQRIHEVTKAPSWPGPGPPSQPIIYAKPFGH